MSKLDFTFTETDFKKDYYMVPVKSHLFFSLIKELVDYSNLKDPVFVDLNLFGPNLLMTEQDIVNLVKVFDRIYFSKDLKNFLLKELELKKIDIRTYLKHINKKDGTGPVAGDKVRLTLDGNNYLVVSVDSKKGLAVINSIPKEDTNVNERTTLRVKLSALAVID